jgi:hypothetical protein
LTTPSLPLLPSDELVASAWLAAVPGLSSAMVGTQLPPDVNADGSVAAWITTGFVTVAVVGGTPDALLPMQRPVMQVECWATVPGSNLPPWWKAAAIAQAILRATWDRYRISRPLTITAGGVVYPTAVVQSAYMATSFRRLYADQADYACFQGDLALTWVTANDHLD